MPGEEATEGRTSADVTAPTAFDADASRTLRVSRTSRPPPPLVLAPGTHIAGRYRIVRAIAAGGYGEVLEVVDERLGATVALKLHRLVSRSPWAMAALRGEFAILATLRHPSLADVYDFGYVGDAAYFTQALVPGVRLDHAGLDLASRRAIELLAQLCRALDYLHARGLLHRDVKPANILVDPATDRLVLLDFGIARALGHAEGGVVVGTHAYLSPEAIRGQPLDARSDLYSLGATLYELAAHQVPFPRAGRDPEDVLWDHLARTPPPLPPEVPPAIAAVIERLLEKDPAARFASAAEVLEALGAALDVPVARDTPETLASYVLSAPYVEHDETLSPLRAHVDAAHPSPPLALVGDAGTGKSRALRELRHDAQLRGTPWITVSARHDDPSHGVLREIAEAILAPEVIAALDPEDRVELARGVPSLRRPREHVAIPVDPERSRRLRIEALGRALELRFRARAGVIVVEDLHRADETLADAIAALAAAAEAAGARCAIVTSARPGPTVDAFARASGARTLACAPLSADASRKLVAATFGRPDLLDGTELGRALAQGGHSALWVQESLRLAFEQGRILRRGGRFHVPRDVPSLSPEAVLAARLGALPEAARHLALACSVWGVAATASELARVSGRSLARAGRALRELVRAGVAEESRDARERATYAMHDRYAEVVRHLFRASDVRAMHLRAARVLRGSRDPHAGGAAGAHFVEAGDPARARASFLVAARQAERSGRPDLALRFVERALAADRAGEDDDPGLVALHLFRHDLALTCAARAAADRSLTWLRIHSARASAIEQAEILLRQARRAASEGQGSRARRLARRSLELAEREGDLAAQTRARLVAGEIENGFGSLEAAATELRAASALATRSGDRAAEARGWLGASLASLHLGHRTEAFEEARRAARAAAQSGDLAARSDAQRQLGNVLREMGRNGRARAHYRLAVSTARACGCLEREAKALNNLGTVDHWLGEVERAMAAYRRSIALKERAGATVAALVGHNNVGALQLAIGQTDAARATLEPLLAPSVSESVVRSIALGNLGDVEAIEGALDAAVDRYRQALELCRARSFQSQRGHALASLARVLLMRARPGDRDEAEVVADELGTLARDYEMAEARRRWHATRAVLEDVRGERRAAVAEARLAVSARDRMTRFSDVFGTPIEVRWILALALARDGRIAAARRAHEIVRRELLQLATLLPEGGVRTGYLERHPIHRAIVAGDLDLPAGWTWRPEVRGGR